MLVVSMLNSYQSAVSILSESSQHGLSVFNHIY